jgi:thiol-disulfide isomerase/thioredoxin
MNTSCNRIKSLAASLCFLLSALVMLDAAPLKEGDSFPDLAAHGLQGQLPDLKGKVLLVDFFASWCGPCKDSFPAMEELHNKYAAKGLVIIAVNLDRKKSDMDQFLKSHPASFTIVRDDANKLVSQVKIPTMPTSFLIDRSGKVHAIHRGFKGDETRHKYAEEIEALLK